MNEPLNVTEMLLKHLTPGTVVVLRGNEAEDWVDQRAEVLDATELNWSVSLLVRVAPETDADDGIREVTVDQLR